MLKIDDSEIKQMESDLKTFAERAFPFATKNTLNRSAFEGQKIARRNIDAKMTQRNKFSKQSVQVEQSRTLNVARQSSSMGSIADYMKDQEFGKIIKKSGKKGVPIATSYAAGQSEGAQPRTRLPRKANTLAAIQLRNKRTRSKTRRQRNLIVIKEAAQSGRKYIFLDLGRSKGIFKVVGGKRRPKIKMVWSMREQSVVVPRNPWLKPAADKVQKLMPEFYRDALKFQLKRQGLFKG